MTGTVRVCVGVDLDITDVRALETHWHTQHLARTGRNAPAGETMIDAVLQLVDWAIADLPGATVATMEGGRPVRDAL